MTALLSLPSLSWSSYRIVRPLTTRAGRLPGQRSELPLSVERLSLWISDLESRGVGLSWEDGAFVLSWPSLESYSFRDVERVRVNWSALVTRYRLRVKESPALPVAMTLAEIPILFLDTETTGTSAEDRVIELCLMGPDRIGTVWRFNNDGTPIQPGAFAVHGISEYDLIEEPLFGQCVDEILEQLEGHALVAHNVGFDARMLRQDFLRAGIEWSPLASIDTVKLSRRLLQLPSHKLGAVADHFGIKHLKDHSARGDVETLASIWEQLVKLLPPNTTLQDLL